MPLFNSIETSKTIKTILIEIFWLVLSFVLSRLILVFAFTSLLRNNEITITLHDTYFIISSQNFINILFFPIYFSILFIRIVVTKFKYKLINTLYIIIIVIMLIGSQFLIEDILKFNSQITQGWTIYPPVSALPKENFDNTDKLANHLYNFLIALRIFLIAILVITFILLVRNRLKKSKNY